MRHACPALPYGSVAARLSFIWHHVVVCRGGALLALQCDASIVVTCIPEPLVSASLGAIGPQANSVHLCTAGAMTTRMYTSTLPPTVNCALSTPNCRLYTVDNKLSATNCILSTVDTQLLAADTSHSNVTYTPSLTTRNSRRSTSVLPLHSLQSYQYHDRTADISCNLSYSTHVLCHYTQ